MIPNRSQILDKVIEFEGQDVVSLISQWLDSVDCPVLDKEKILDDLGSYNN